MLFLALALIGICFWIAWRLTALLRRGAAAASVAQDRRFCKWREVTGLGKNVHSGNVYRLAVLRDWAVRLLGDVWKEKWFRANRNRPMAVKKTIFFDPVDGTSFSPGETVIRCGCGAVYHSHSWQWLSEKNGGKCVSCKRAGISTTAIVPRMAS